MKWFRLYAEARNDAKLRYLSDSEFRVWFNLLCFASEQENRGTVPASNLTLLAVEVANGDEDLLKTTLDKLKMLAIIQMNKNEISFINWEKRQYDNPSDRPEQVKKRVAGHRNRKRNKSVTSCNDPVTTSNDQTITGNESVTNCNALDTDTDTDIYSTTTPLPPSFKEGESVVVVDEIDVEAEKREVTKFMTNSFIIGASAFQVEMLTNWIDDGMRADAIIYAMEIALAANKREPRYVKGILKKWFEAGVRTRKQAEEFVRQQGARAQPEKDKDKNNAPRGVVYYDAAEELAKLKRRTGS